VVNPTGLPLQRIASHSGHTPTCVAHPNAKFELEGGSSPHTYIVECSKCAIEVYKTWKRTYRIVGWHSQEFYCLRHVTVYYSLTLYKVQFTYFRRFPFSTQNVYFSLWNLRSQTLNKCLKYADKKCTPILYSLN